MASVAEIVEWALAVLLAIVSFFLKGVIDDNKALQKQVNELHEVYVKKDDFKEFKEELWNRLDDMKEEIKKR